MKVELLTISRVKSSTFFILGGREMENEFKGIQRLEIDDSRMGYLIMKRIFDVVSCLVGLIILSPVFLLTALAIKIEDPKGKVFYAHYRVGKNGAKIPVYKFRSMFSNSDELFKQFTPEQKAEFEEFQKLKDDPRVTKVGKFIRKTSIDELPQFVNVLKGEMSVVGPRPITLKELERYGNYQEAYLAVLPGLTGMWQAYGRSNLTYEERIMMDVKYVEKRGMKLDLMILCQTVKVVLLGEGAV